MSAAGASQRRAGRSGSHVPTPRRKAWRVADPLRSTGRPTSRAGRARPAH